MAASQQRLRTVLARPRVHFAGEAGAGGYPPGALEHVRLNEPGPHLKAWIAEDDGFLLGFYGPFQPSGHTKRPVVLEVVE